MISSRETNVCMHHGPYPQVGKSVVGGERNEKKYYMLNKRDIVERREELITKGG